MIRVFLADPQSLIRKAVRSLLEREFDIVVVGEASDGLSAVPLAEESGFDILITDFSEPRPDEVEQAIAAVRAVDASVAVVVLSRYEDTEFQECAMTMGADAYVSKDMCDPELIDAIRTVAGHRRLATA